MGIQKKDWILDGPDRPARKPTTYQELARAVSMLQEETADIKATGTNDYDHLMSLTQSAGGKGSYLLGGGTE